MYAFQLDAYQHPQYLLNLPFNWQVHLAHSLNDWAVFGKSLFVYDDTDRLLSVHEITDAINAGQVAVAHDAITSPWLRVKTPRRHGLRPVAHTVSTRRNRARRSTGWKQHKHIRHQWEVHLS